MNYCGHIARAVTAATFSPITPFVKVGEGFGGKSVAWLSAGALAGTVFSYNGISKLYEAYTGEESPFALKNTLEGTRINTQFYTESGDKINPKSGNAHKLSTASRVTRAFWGTIYILGAVGAFSSGMQSLLQK